MRVFNKRHNPLFFALLSLIPFIGFYPLLKLGKTRRMFLIDLGIIGAAYVISFLMLRVELKSFLLPVFCAIPLFSVVQSILVHGWAKEHNKVRTEEELI